MMRRLAWPFAAIGLAATSLGVLGTIVVRIVSPAPFLPVAFGFGPTVMVAFLVMAVIWATVGGFLVIRRPENVIGWIIVVVGVGYALSMLSTALTFAFAADGTAEGLRMAEFAAWATVLCTQVGAFAFVIGFIFPTGHAQSRRWAHFLQLFWLMLLVFSAIVLFQPGGLHLAPTLRNPFGFGPDLRGGQQIAPIVALFAAIIFPAAALSLVTRYRMASRIERQQLKWLMLTLLLSTIGLGVVFYASVLTRGPQDELGLTLYAVALASVPVAIGIAILRHGLYDIDRILSRTIAYALISAVLVATYAAAILVLTGPLGNFFGGDTISVALSTLVVAALFQPVRRRVQVIVDRRFDRARVDAERTTSAFSERLRDEVDIDAVTTDLRQTVHTTVRPVRLEIWLRETGR